MTADTKSLARRMVQAVRSFVATKTDPLTARLRALELRCAVLERVWANGERSVGVVQSEQLEELIATLKMPVAPIHDKNGKLIGARRTENPGDFVPVLEGVHTKPPATSFHD